MLAFLTATAFGLLFLRNLFAVVMLSGMYSLLSAALFVVMDAVDVAFTEAAVGAGISTVLMLGTLARTSGRQRLERDDSWLAFGIVLVTGAALLYGTLDMPHYGDPNAPAHQHVGLKYLMDSPSEIDIPNVVTSVLASYRGYDTLGEVVVIFTAGIAVLALLVGGFRQRARPGQEARDHEHADTEAAPREEHPVLHVVSKLLVPLILLFALYVQFHGDFGPGGGFQAGVIFAAGVILYAMVFGVDKARGVAPSRLLHGFMAAGLLLYAGIGVLGLLLGGNYLEYGVLSSDPVHGQHLGIMLIEFGVGTTVAATMLSLYYAFAR